MRDLVQRLRDYRANNLLNTYLPLCIEAADRIEALESDLEDVAEYKKLHDECVAEMTVANENFKRLHARIEALEAEKTRLLEMLKELSGAVQLDMLEETYPRQVLFVMAKLTKELE
jgi:predicted nuclease with TOPRIM domain